jgi:hypothetical protein
LVLAVVEVEMVVLVVVVVSCDKAPVTHLLQLPHSRSRWALVVLVAHGERSFHQRSMAEIPLLKINQDRIFLLQKEVRAAVDGQLQRLLLVELVELVELRLWAKSVVLGHRR